MQLLRSILLGAFILLFSAAVFAQGHRGERRGFDLEQMTKQLDLSAEQAAKLKTIHEEQRAAFAKLAEGMPEGQRPDREQMRSLMKDSRQKMMDVLTPEQLEKLKAERRNQPKGERGSRRPKNKDALRAEMRRYRSETIIPKFIAVRSAFDSKLSSTERAQISKLREAVRAELGEQGLKQMVSRGSANRGKQRSGYTKNREREAEENCNPSNEENCEPEGSASAQKATGREGQRSEMRAFMQKYKTDVEAVRAIVKAHPSELADVRSEIDAAKAQWKKDGNAIRAKHLSAEDLARHNTRLQKRGGRKGSAHRAHGAKENGEGMSRSDRGAFMFLLMDPTSMETEGFEEISNENLSAYPNPATNQTTLKFDVRASGPVRVELIDVSGKVLKTVLNADREAQVYELPVALPASMGNTGLLRVTDALGMRTVRVTRG